MNVYIKIFIFFIFLFSSTLYLLKSGFWFFQDAGFWPKTLQESMLLIDLQFHSFARFSYFLGYDLGLLNFTRIIVNIIQSVFLLAFGYSGSQIAFSFFGFILSFTAFYLFSGIFISNKKFRFFLSLFYTFSPFAYSLQGYIYFNAISPLFIYSFYKYLYGEGKLRALYLLINVFAVFLWISYIRFVESNFIVVIPYLAYLIYKNLYRTSVKRILLLGLTYFIVILPVIYSLVAQVLEGSKAAFNYGSILGRFVSVHKMYDAYNVFQSKGVNIYNADFWSIAGILFFLPILVFITISIRKKKTVFLLLNLSLVTLGIAIYSLGNIFSDQIYFKLLSIFPFVTNEPYWAFYVVYLPFVMLVALVTASRLKFFYFYSLTFIILATFPFLNLSDFQLQKYKLSEVPKPYQEFIFTNLNQVPEATHYLPETCWRAEYMDKANVPTMCVNYGIQYSPISYANPRTLSGKDYYLSQLLINNTNVNNLRVTHNLKNIIVANDIVKTKGPGLLTEDIDIKRLQTEREIFDNNDQLIANKNLNFTKYQFKNKSNYDFFIYSPRQIVVKEGVDSINDNSLKIKDKPVVFSQPVRTSTQDARIDYKIDPFNPTKYYIRVSQVNTSKPFIIQFNQSFNKNWKLKWVDREYFEKEKCTSKWEYFSITNSSRCQYKSSLLRLQDIQLSNNEKVSENQHIQGNYLSNTWIVDPNTIPDIMKKEDTLYAVIIYEKQVYYSYTVAITGLTILVIVVLTLIQEGRGQVLTIKRKK